LERIKKDEILKDNTNRDGQDRQDEIHWNQRENYFVFALYILFIRVKLLVEGPINGLGFTGWFDAKH
jgi:hypothetical protein